MEKILKKNKSGLKKKLRFANPKLLVRSITDIQKNTDLLVDETINKGVSFDCKKGCSTCCSLRVEVLPPEAFIIAHHIKAASTDVKNKYIEKLTAQANYAKGKKLNEYKRPCSFLTSSGACGIYEVRPQKCRANLSKNLDACISNRNAEEDQDLSVATYQLVKDSVALYKSKKCVMHPSELSQSVLAALQDETLEDQWASGKQVFELVPEKYML